MTGEPPAAIHIFIHTGEVSGDLQGALLVEALYRQAEQQGYRLTISAMGGERMAKAGARLVGDTVPISAIGIFESWPYLVSTLQLQRRAKQHLKAHPPDAVVLIDYMGPNIAMGNYVRSVFPQVPIAYYIAPQQWVWSLTPRDTQRILRVADQLLAIFPEEARYYERQGGNVYWVGHPLVDQFPQDPTANRQAARHRLGLAEAETVVTLLPASRKQELTYVMPVMFAAAQQIQAQLDLVTFLVPVSRPAFRERLVAGLKHYGLTGRLVEAQTQDAIAAADLAITKSGTANLEMALMKVPQVVMYRLNPVTAWVAYRLLRFSANFISPVNLVEMKPVVPEFIQWQATPEAIRDASLALLLNPDQRQAMLKGYEQMRTALGQPGVCDRAATEILEMIQRTA
jgi:lipid-A-disaccharide synthase